MVEPSHNMRRTDVTNPIEADAKTAPIMSKLDDILLRLENVEANLEEVLEKLQDEDGSLDFHSGLD